MLFLVTIAVCAALAGMSELEKDFYFETFTNESDLEPIIRLVERDLSEPYSIYTYRFFIYDFPRMCIMCRDRSTAKIVGVVIGKAFIHRGIYRGYVAMLAVDEAFRKRGIAKRLSQMLLDEMYRERVAEVVLETEDTNSASLSLYEKLGFVRDKFLPNYYLNGSAAFRLKLWFH